MQTVKLLLLALLSAYGSILIVQLIDPLLSNQAFLYVSLGFGGVIALILTIVNCKKQWDEYRYLKKNNFID